MFFRKIREIKILKILMVVFAVVVFAGPTWAGSDDIEVTLGFGWRNSDRGLGMIENYITDDSFPFTLVLDESVRYFYDDYGNERILHYRKWATFDIIKRNTQIHKRANFVFGLDFPTYKELTIGFELSVGFTERKIKGFYEKDWDYTPDSIWEKHEEYEIDYQEIIIPINFFLNAKYKFDQVKDVTGFLRPYVGCGGGISTAVNFSDRLIGTQFSQLPDEKIGINGIGVGMVGIDLWITKKLAVFGETRYIKVFGHKSHVEFVTGLRLK